MYSGQGDRQEEAVSKTKGHQGQSTDKENGHEGGHVEGVTSVLRISRVLVVITTVGIISGFTTSSSRVLFAHVVHGGAEANLLVVVQLVDVDEEGKCCSGKCVGKCLLACFGPKVLIAFGSISLGLLVGLYRTVTDWEKYYQERMMLGNYPEEDQKDDQEFLAKTTKSFKFPIKLPKKQQVKEVFLPGQPLAPSVLSLDNLIRKQFDKYQLFFILEIVLVAVFVVAYFALKVKRAKRRKRNGKQEQQQLLKTTLAKRTSFTGSNSSLSSSSILRLENCSQPVVVVVVATVASNILESDSERVDLVDVFVSFRGGGGTPFEEEFSAAVADTAEPMAALVAEREFTELATMEVER
ncbi:hypothetical protein TYRP_003797 [Tyrophagus putrescentiae]|nr:hypothetical protein TYRP_003797 [Tyrophagus putrescentiae]